MIRGVEACPVSLKTGRVAYEYCKELQVAIIGDVRSKTKVFLCCNRAIICSRLDYRKLHERAPSVSFTRITRAVRSSANLSGTY